RSGGASRRFWHWAFGRALRAPTPRLLGLLHDLEDAPALLARDRARLGDADEVAHAAFVLLVVDLEARALLHGLAVQAVRLGRAHLDDDGLVHLVGDHSPEADTATAARRGDGGSGGDSGPASLSSRPRC